MTLEDLQRDWQNYALEIDAYFPKENKRIKDKVILKEKFFACFIMKDVDALLFDPGGHDPICVALRPDANGDCLLKFPDGTWGKIGKFVLL